MTRRLWAMVVAATAMTPLVAAPPEVLPAGTRLDDARLGPPRTLAGYFPFTPVADAAAWPARREAIRRRVLVAAGLWPMPDRPELRPVIHGRIDQGDYTIEKVFFESFPGHFVTGNLYRPAGAALAAGRPRDGRRPGVLCPHGHWPDGRFIDAGADAAAKEIEVGAERFECGARSVLQARCVGLARMGCVVFHYDMLGYADSIQFPAHRHGPQPALDGHEPGSWGFVGSAAIARLQTPFGAQTFNSVRALDFLLGLPDVDAGRVAVTGASGGGTQTMVLAAIDDRVAAAFPAVMVSTAMQGGCPCENAAHLRIGQGNVDIAAAAAPRPLGLTAADDWTKELEQKGWPDLAGLYRMLGVPDRAEAHFDIRFPHNYNAVARSHCYRFVDRVFALGQADAGVEREFDRLDRARLTVWDDAHPAPAGAAVGDDHERALCRAWADDSARQIAPLLVPADAAGLAQARDLLGGAVEVIIGRAPPAAAEVAFEPSAAQPAAAAGAAAIEAGLVRVIPHDERIPALVLRPAAWKGDVAVWPHPRGKQGLFTAAGDLEPEVRAVLDRGTAVIAADLFGQGENTADGRPLEANPGVRYPGPVVEEADRWRLDPVYFYGYNPAAFARRVHDLTALVAFARGGLGGPARQVTLVGIDGAGHWAAGALAALRPWAAGAAPVDRAVIDTAGFRFGGLRDVWSADFLPGAVKYGDLPVLLGLGLPTALVVHDPDPACGRLLQAWARAAGDPTRVTLVADAADLSRSITATAGAVRGGIEIDTVAVGSPGNPPDANGRGAVPYPYRIGTYEVTAGQYAAFLDAVAAEDTHSLYDPAMADPIWGCGIHRTGTPGAFRHAVAPEFANRPVNHVSYWNACRFANWLSNGQPRGPQDGHSTESGAYRLDGYNGPDGRDIVRTRGWQWAVTSDDEWYKAAYFDAGRPEARFWRYPTRSDEPPGRDRDDASGNNANWNDTLPPSPAGPLSTVAGAFAHSPSGWGTFDQGGNVCEWTETAVPIDERSAARRRRGGSFADGQGTFFLRSDASRDDFDGGWRHGLTGFRVSRSVEPPAGHGGEPRLASHLLEPGYRGWLYESWPAALRVAAVVDDRQAATRREALRLRAVLTSADGREMAQQVEDVAGLRTDLVIDRPRGLEPGRHLLRVSLEDRRSGRVVAATGHPLVQWPGEAPEARCWIDRHGRLIVDGRPFFPLGLFAELPEEEELRLIAEAGFNCVMPYYLYGQTGASLEAQRRYLDAAERIGVKTIYSTKDIYDGPMIAALEQLHGWRGREAILRGLVETFRGHPNVIAWYTNDEKGVADAPQVVEHYEIIRSLDEDHPIWMCDFRPEVIREFWDSADVFGVDWYPIAWLPIRSTGDAAAQARGQLFAARPRWDVPQAHNLGIYSPGASDTRPPTAEELRCMCYQFLATGATGLILYCYDDLERDPKAPFSERWRDVRGVAAELSGLGPILLSVAEPLPVGVESAGPVRWFSRAHADVTHLFLVNAGTEPATASLTLPGAGLRVAVDGVALGESGPGGSLPAVALPARGVRHVEIGSPPDRHAE